MDKDIEKWESEFDEKFGAIRHRGFPQQAIKAFILQLLTQQKESIRGKVEGIFKIPTFCGKCNWGGKLCKECYADCRANAALQEVITLLAN